MHVEQEPGVVVARPDRTLEHAAPEVTHQTWVPLTALKTPFQTAISRMLPPLRLYNQVNTIAPQDRPMTNPT